MEDPSVVEIWADRVARWRASGEKSADFGRREGFAGTTLLWWSSRFNKEKAASEGVTKAAAAPVQLARVVRTTLGPLPETVTRRIVVEFDGLRIVVEPGADEATLAMVMRAASGARR